MKVNHFASLQIPSATQSPHERRQVEFVDKLKSEEIVKYLAGRAECMGQIAGLAYEGYLVSIDISDGISKREVEELTKAGGYLRNMQVLWENLILQDLPDNNLQKLLLRISEPPKSIKREFKPTLSLLALSAASGKKVAQQQLGTHKIEKRVANCMGLTWEASIELMKHCSPSKAP